MVSFVVSFLGCVVGLLGWLSLIDLGVSSTRVSFPPDEAGWIERPRRSARIDHFRSPKVTHTKNTICRWARKTTSDIIHAEGVRFAVPSSAPQARNALSLREDIRALSKSISHRSAAPPGSHVICLRAKSALPSGKSATSFRWWWVTFGEQSRVISRERRREVQYHRKLQRLLASKKDCCGLRGGRKPQSDFKIAGGMRTRGARVWEAVEKTGQNIFSFR